MSRRRSRITWILFLTVAFNSLFLPAANAYIDPGTGSFIFQAVIGFLVAAALGIKVFWRKLVGIFHRGPKDAVEPAVAPDADSADSIVQPSETGAAREH
jgi:hypothetical protein